MLPTVSHTTVGAMTAPAPVVGWKWLRIADTAIFPHRHRHAGGPPLPVQWSDDGTDFEIAYDTYDHVLVSEYNGTVWPPGEPLEARCTVCHHPPARMCCMLRSPRWSDPDGMCRSCLLHETGWGCGIYAIPFPEGSPIGWGSQVVLIQVRGWGRVMNHSRGWRAQFAEPIAMAVPEGASLPPSWQAVVETYNLITVWAEVIEHWRDEEIEVTSFSDPTRRFIRQRQSYTRMGRLIDPV